MAAACSFTFHIRGIVLIDDRELLKIYTPYTVLFARVVICVMWGELNLLKLSIANFFPPILIFEVEAFLWQWALFHTWKFDKHNAKFYQQNQ
jgi:hypothetical protein